MPARVRSFTGTHSGSTWWRMPGWKRKYDMNENTFDIRLQRLEDIEAIKKLTATYALYVNKGWNGKTVDFEKLPLVFAENRNRLRVPLA